MGIFLAARAVEAALVDADGNQTPVIADVSATTDEGISIMNFRTADGEGVEIPKGSRLVVAWSAVWD